LRLAGLTVALLCLATAARSDAAGEALVREVAAMGTTLRVEVMGSSRSLALAAAERAIRAVEDAEARLSTWRDDSELARLARAPRGVAVPVSPELAAELEAALACGRSTGGAFHPLLGELVRAWGLRQGGRVPAEGELAAALAAAGAAQIRVTRVPPSVRMSGATPFEEGAWAKGAALDAALAAALRQDGAPAVLLDFGGQLAWTGGAGAWVAGLADPRRRSRPVLELALARPRGSLASSGNSERSGHLLDPRTGRPAPDFGSVTVVADGALEADCLSTALFVMGPEAGLAWLERSGGGAEAVYLVVEGGRLRARASAGLAGRLRPLVPDAVVEDPNGPS